MSNVLPGLTILLDCPPAMALERIGKMQLGFAMDAVVSAHSTRRATEGFRLEDESLDFHNRVYEGYRELARAEPERWHVVDASRPVEEISESIWEAVSRRLEELEAAAKPA